MVYYSIIKDWDHLRSSSEGQYVLKISRQWLLYLGQHKSYVERETEQIKCQRGGGVVALIDRTRTVMHKRRKISGTQKQAGTQNVCHCGQKR